MMKKILVPIDGSKLAYKAIEFAANLAMQNDGTIHLLHVVEQTHVPDAVMDYIKSEGIRETPDSVYLQVVGKWIIDTAVDETRKKGVKHIESNLIVGDPAGEIINYARDHKFDIIVMGSRGLGGDHGMRLGSVSGRVCHEADQTCVTVRKDLLEGERILIVDDEPDVLDTLEELLAVCDVVKASSFDEAKKLLETQYFDIAILDIMGVEGYKLLEIANKRKVIAVMLTANALSPKDTVKSFKKGAASYVPKDQMGNIATFLTDILEAKRKGKKFWWRWLDRLDSFYDRAFGPDWQKTDKQFWKKYKEGLYT